MAFNMYYSYLNDINFHYNNTARAALKNINLKISSKTTVGIVGSTGSGKTTTVDIILGLLKPQEGCLKIDGNLITDNNIRSWQKSIGYVPQQIYLSDDTVAANIAFGVDYEDIDQEEVERVAKISNLHEFVINELPMQYKTKVGERGVQLSGGQRQGVAVARATSFGTKVVIMDEPTAALGVKESRRVLELISEVRARGIPIILISHNMPHVFEVADRIHIHRLGTRLCVIDPKKHEMSDAVAFMTGAKEPPKPN